MHDIAMVGERRQERAVSIGDLRHGSHKQCEMTCAQQCRLDEIVNHDCSDQCVRDTRGLSVV